MLDQYNFGRDNSGLKELPFLGYCVDWIDIKKFRHTGMTAKITIIIAIWRHRLNLHGFIKPEYVRIIVVGPPNLLVDESK